MDEDKVKAKIDLWVKIALWGSCFIIIASGFSLESDEVLLYLVTTIPVVIMLGWIMLGSYYELREDYLYIRLGPFFKKIMYDNIRTLKLTRNWLSSMALSIERIEIIEKEKRFYRGGTMISPINREAFLEELRTRCYNLEK